MFYMPTWRKFCTVEIGLWITTTTKGSGTATFLLVGQLRITVITLSRRGYNPSLLYLIDKRSYMYEFVVGLMFSTQQRFMGNQFLRKVRGRHKYPVYLNVICHIGLTKWQFVISNFIHIMNYVFLIDLQSNKKWQWIQFELLKPSSWLFQLYLFSWD